MRAILLSLFALSAPAFAQTSIALMPQQGSNFYRPNNYNACSRISGDFYKQQCIQLVANHQFSQEALGVCANLQSDFYIVDCVTKIADKYYDPQAAFACGSMSSDFSVNSCLEGTGQYGGAPYPQQPNFPGPNYGPNYGQPDLGDVILDALDSILRETLSQHSNRGSGGMCVIKTNGGNTRLGSVYESEFIATVIDFAISQNTCVVTNIKGKQRTRTLIDSNGTILESRRTEKEISDDKKYYGFDRCRNITCELN